MARTDNTLPDELWMEEFPKLAGRHVVILTVRAHKTERSARIRKYWGAERARVRVALQDGRFVGVDDEDYWDDKTPEPSLPKRRAVYDTV